MFQSGICVQVGGYASYWNVFLFQGGVHVQAGGTRPTGMFSCFRVVFVFGKRLSDTIEDITPTYLTPRVLATLREADTIANKVLRDSGTHFILLIAYIIHLLRARSHLATATQIFHVVIMSSEIGCIVTNVAVHT